MRTTLYPMQETRHSAWLKNAAANGNAQAAFEYGRWILRRAASPTDEENGRNYVRRAAEGGYLPAIYDEIVEPLYHGADNLDELAEWFRYAIGRNDGDKLVRFFDGFLRHDNPRKFHIGMQMCMMMLNSPQAPDLNCDRMAFRAGFLARCGDPWRAKSGKLLLRRLLDVNGADFCAALAESDDSCWYSADCVRRAYLWWHMAAKRGHVDALFRLGVCYARGRGTRRNAAKAAQFFREAASHGHKAAADALAEIDGGAHGM